MEHQRRRPAGESSFMPVAGLTTEPQPDTLSRRVLLVLALACGVCVANVYFPQAISPLIATQFGISRSAAALVPTASQLGYATGLFLLVPLGDRVKARPLILILLALTTAGLIAGGIAPDLRVLVLSGAAVGITTVVPQILLPMAAGLVSEQRRGAVTGMPLSGLLGGILLARTFSGILGGWLGWRAPYLIAAGLALVLVLAGPAYHLGTQAVGVLALVGAGSVFATPVAGRRIDRNGPDPVSLVCFIGALTAAAAPGWTPRA
jgi:predicted MFS family arabinose efflux permease